MLLQGRNLFRLQKEVITWEQTIFSDDPSTSSTASERGFRVKLLYAFAFWMAHVRSQETVVFFHQRFDTGKSHSSNVYAGECPLSGTQFCGKSGLSKLCNLFDYNL